MITDAQASHVVGIWPEDRQGGPIPEKDSPKVMLEKHISSNQWIPGSCEMSAQQNSSQQHAAIGPLARIIPRHPYTSGAC
jgi:hypothetical protein